MQEQYLEAVITSLSPLCLSFVFSARYLSRLAYPHLFLFFLSSSAITSSCISFSHLHLSHHLSLFFHHLPLLFPPSPSAIFFISHHYSLFLYHHLLLLLPSVSPSAFFPNYLPVFLFSFIIFSYFFHLHLLQSSPSYLSPSFSLLSPSYFISSSFTSFSLLPIISLTPFFSFLRSCLSWIILSVSSHRLPHLYHSDFLTSIILVSHSFLIS